MPKRGLTQLVGLFFDSFSLTVRVGNIKFIAVIGIFASTAHECYEIVETGENAPSHVSFHTLFLDHKS